MSRKGILEALNARQADLIRVFQTHGLNLARETLAMHAKRDQMSKTFRDDIDFLKMHGIISEAKQGYVELTDWAQEALK